MKAYIEKFLENLELLNGSIQMPDHIERLYRDPEDGTRYRVHIDTSGRIIRVDMEYVD